jgi:hypothetical protein
VINADDVLNAIEKHDNVDFQDLCLALIQKQAEYIKFLNFDPRIHGYEAKSTGYAKLLRTQISVIDEQISKHIN